MLNSSEFDTRMSALFEYLGGRYQPVVDEAVDVVLTIDDLISVVFSEPDSGLLQIEVDLGPLPQDDLLRSSRLEECMRANGEQSQTSFKPFYAISSDGLNLLLLNRLGLEKLEIEELVEAFNDMVDIGLSRDTESDIDASMASEQAAVING